MSQPGDGSIFLEPGGGFRLRLRMQGPNDSRPLSSGFVYGEGKDATFDPAAGKAFTAAQLRAIADLMEGTAERDAG